MTLSIRTALDPPNGAQVAISALESAPYAIKEQAGAEIRTFGQKLANEAAAAAKRHPSGLWKNAGAARYSLARTDLLTVRVQSPVMSVNSGVGKALVMSEFAHNAPKRPDFVKTLTKIYGRDGTKGRILWAAYDSGESGYISDIEKAVSKYADKLQTEVNHG
jgi:hypothetical protein